MFFRAPKPTPDSIYTKQKNPRSQAMVTAAIEHVLVKFLQPYVASSVPRFLRFRVRV